MRRMIALLLGLTCMSTLAPAAAAIPTAHHVRSIPTVGPLFLSAFGLGPRLELPHYCSASVVHSPTHDLAITAAHCVYGNGSGIEFAPGYSGRSTPFGVWDVSRIYLDPAWLRDRAPQHDFAVLALARHGTAGVEDVTGRAPQLGVAPAAGTKVTVDGYPAGSGGTPITCTARVYYTHRFPSFDCNGFTAGVSGGPWLAGGRLVGTTGGLHQGGCTASTSYTSAFRRDVAVLLARAAAGGPGDNAPLPGSDGC